MAGRHPRSSQPDDSGNPKTYSGNAKFGTRVVPVLRSALQANILGHPADPQEVITEVFADLADAGRWAATARSPLDNIVEHIGPHLGDHAQCDVA
jgi:hypothetical protein